MHSGKHTSLSSTGNNQTNSHESSETCRQLSSTSNDQTDSPGLEPLCQRVHTAFEDVCVHAWDGWLTEEEGG